MDPIVAAASDADRRELADFVRGARYEVRAIAADAASLARLLRSEREAWVLTGGTLSRATPFLSTARSARSPVVAVLAGTIGAEDRADLRYAGLAVLRGASVRETLPLALAASRAGLSVWDPELDAPAELAESLATPLSPRERTVLQRTGAGLSTKAVARELGISPNTVKYHLQSAFEKLGVASRAEAVMAAVRRGELSV